MSAVLCSTFSMCEYISFCFCCMRCSTFIKMGSRLIPDLPSSKGNGVTGDLASFTMDVPWPLCPDLLLFDRFLSCFSANSSKDYLDLAKLSEILSNSCICLSPLSKWAEFGSSSPCVTILPSLKLALSSLRSPLKFGAWLAAPMSS